MIPLIELQNIKLSYSNNVVLDSVSLKIFKGEVISIIGPSGGGKTSLLKAFNLLLTPIEGKIIYNGEEIFHAYKTKLNSKSRYFINRLIGNDNIGIKKDVFCELHKYRSKFGMVFQDYNLWPNFTLKENIAKPLIWKKESEIEFISKIVKEKAEVVQIGNILSKYPSEASGGEQQRTAIARVLALNPEILLLDEITSALDPELVFGILTIIEELSKTGITLVLVTHHMRFAQRVSNRIIYVGNRGIIGPFTTNELFNTNNEIISNYLKFFRDL